MEYITTPWREDYVKKVFKMKECVFCQAIKKGKKGKDESFFVLFRGEHNFILLNKYPYTPGHLMIAPYAHLDSIEHAEKKSTEEMMALLKKCLKILRKEYNPQGFNTGMNIGHSAGAGVADHYHLHVIPRWIGDSNFMPIVGKTKVMLKDLQATYDQLFPHFQIKEKT